MWLRILVSMRSFPRGKSSDYSLPDVDIDCQSQRSLTLSLGEQHRNLSFFILSLNCVLT